MASKTRVETPMLEVWLKKTVRDQSGKSSRYTGGQKAFNLAPFLSEDSAVTCSRSINAPAGSFQVSLADRGIRHGATMDSIYGIAEPMDIVEIRFAQRPHEYAGKLPLVFRGVISEVRRDESMGQDGKPRRTVVLAGQDWGKFLQINQIRYIKGNPLREDWLSGLVMQTHFGINYGVHSAGTVITDLTQKVANPFLARYGDPDIVQFLVDVSGADPADKVMPQGFQNFPGGTLWEYFHTFGDLGPFYELFIDDTEAGPKLVYRKPPFFTADGDAIYGAIPESVNVEPRQITRLSSSRSDANVANWFWIDHRRLSMLGPDMIVYSLGNNPYGSFLENPNSKKELYGIKTLEIASNHGYMYQAAKEPGVQVDQSNFIVYNTEKIAKLKLANQDNVVFESGSITMEGNERVKVGRNVRVKRGKNVGLYYANTVTHSFMPFRSFTTSVGFTRGTGFINRSTGTGNPYLEEIGRGPGED